MDEYVSKANPTVIKFSSRASVKLTRGNQDHYYTFEYGEERQINDFNQVNLDKERQLLEDDCNREVDKQLEEIFNAFLEK